ncbi:hypothetical protein [Streptomyces vietnamensis]|uniref:Uncharacterized protein n=1 Tax=Streptomyces vietnamensis TaxID=362257 RepID=A0A0B5ICS5_9ACTN|nr:hypothetical protein [Streptomyces vietnamensis]AJF70321.1 hypothetical protein SVTN_39545 [Streptomyces vietnamensis]
MAGQKVWAAVAVVCTVVVMGLVLVVVLADLETADKIASVVGASVGVIGLAVSVFALTRGEDTPPVAGTRSVQARGGIGRVVTGDNNHLTTPAPRPQPPAGADGGAGGLAVPGERGVAADGSIGEAVTGDGNQQP